ncbi:hypothetical protein N9051_00065 [Akkermansiaceae bacterium]|nr:hypothetical protein [Akkermansiaceae bacterium]
MFKRLSKLVKGFFVLFVSGMVTEIGGSGDTLNRLEEMVEDKRAKAAGRARVARDQMDMGDINAKEAEQCAFADMTLAEFAAQDGIELETAPTASDAALSEPTKTKLGPESESA